MTKQFKKINIKTALIIIAIIAIAGVGFLSIGSVIAQTNTQDASNPVLTEEQQTEFRQEMQGIMEKYGMVPEISREQFVNMHGDMYDLMEKYGLNPGMFMSQMQRGMKGMGGHKQGGYQSGMFR